MKLHEWLSYVVLAWMAFVLTYAAMEWRDRTNFDMLEQHVNWRVLHLPGQDYYIHFIVTDGVSYRAWGYEK